MLLGNGHVHTTGRLVLRDLRLTARGAPGTSGRRISTTLLRLLDELARDHRYRITALESGGTGHAFDQRALRRHRR